MVSETFRGQMSKDDFITYSYSLPKSLISVAQSRRIKSSMPAENAAVKGVQEN
jgi:hypothetical protein